VAEYDFIDVRIFGYYQPDFRLYTVMVPNASRPGSKYCSDQCGLKLATTRNYQVSYFNSFVNKKTVGKCRFRTDFASTHSLPCIAEEKNKKELEQNS
jgi:hypothetical protein